MIQVDLIEKLLAYNPHEKSVSENPTNINNKQ
jgi:hypothetical protein